MIFVQDYENLESLFTREDDAKFVESLFKHLRFDTTKIVNPTGKEMQKWINDFINENKGKEKVRMVIYYSGLTRIQDEMTFLLPVDAAREASTSALNKGAYSIDKILKSIERTSIEDISFFIDACAFSNRWVPETPEPQVVITKDLLVPARQFLIACGEGDSHLESIHFSETLADLFAGRNDIDVSDGYVTTKEIAKIFIKKYKEAIGDRRQTPYYASLPNPLYQGDTIFKLVAVNAISQLRYATENATGKVETIQRVFGRDIPSVDGEIVTTIPSGTRIDVIGKSIGKNWYRVNFEGKEFFVHSGQTKSVASHPIIFPDEEKEFVRLDDIDDGDILDFLDVGEEESVKRDDISNGSIIKSCTKCPEMVIIGNNEFLMGESSVFYKKHTLFPAHRVSLNHLFGIARTETTVAEFKAFVQDTGYQVESGCEIFVEKEWVYSEKSSWKSPGFDQNDNHPVVCVNKEDISNYIEWLNSIFEEQEDIRIFRLPSEAEWEFANRGDAKGVFFWGEQIERACVYANFRDYLTRNAFGIPSSSREFIQESQCSDDTIHTSEVGSYRTNPFGLYDLTGNVAEITEDCWHENYNNAPRDGSAWIRYCSTPNTNVVRGGSWISEIDFLRASERIRYPSSKRKADVGFRVVRTLRYSQESDFKQKFQE